MEVLGMGGPELLLLLVRRVVGWVVGGVVLDPWLMTIGGPKVVGRGVGGWAEAFMSKQLRVVERIMKTGVVAPPNLLGEGVLGLGMRPLVDTHPFRGRLGGREVC